MKKSTIWISYDLGIQGDYASLYAWLDSHAAKECGDSLALLIYSHNGDIKAALTAELEQSIIVDKRTRIYVIYHDKETNKNTGAFLFGGRRAPAWTGYASKSSGAVDEEEV